MTTHEKVLLDLVLQDNLCGIGNYLKVNPEAITPLKSNIYSIPSSKEYLLPKDNLSLIHLAAFADSLDCFIFLINNKLEIDRQSAENHTPLHYAIINHSVEVANYIIHCREDLCNQLRQQKNIIFLACAMNEPDLLRSFIEKKADLTQLKNQYDQLMLACCQSKSFLCLAQLLDIITNKECLEEAIKRAIQNDDVPFVRRLLEALQGSKSYQRAILTLFRVACELHRDSIALEIGPLFVNVNIQDSSDSTPLHFAISSLNKDIVSVILQKNPKFDVFDAHGRPPAHILANVAPSSAVRMNITNVGLEILNLLKDRDYPFDLQSQKSPTKSALKGGLTLLAAFVTAITKNIDWIVWLLNQDVSIHYTVNDATVSLLPAIQNMAFCNAKIKLAIEEYQKRKAA